MPEQTKHRRKPLGFNLGAEIEKARVRAGISRSELSRRTNISRTVLIGYETGRTTPGAREIHLICDALKVTPNRLFYGKEGLFSEKDGPWPDLIDSEDEAAIRLPLLFKMLARDERAAVLTLIHSLLEARHGRAKFTKVIEAQIAYMRWFQEMLREHGPDFERNLSPDQQAKLKASVKNLVTRFEKFIPPGKKARAR